MQSPMARTRLGFDHWDHLLDIVVAPDRSWRYKDEDELELCLETGRMTAATALAVREEGCRVIEQIEANALPVLPGDWVDLTMYSV